MLGRRQNAPRALRFLKDEVDQPYRMLYDLTAIDERMRMHREGQPASDFTMVYHLLSFDRNEYLRVKVPLKQDQPPIDTSTDLWPAANWYEREVWDMFGIRFRRPSASGTNPDAENVGGTSAMKDHPARATEMGPFQLPDEKQEAEQEALVSARRLGHEAGTRRDGFHVPERRSAASWHARSIARIFQLDGEEIVDAVPEIGFHHRGAEKMGERQSWHTYIPYTDRMDYLGGVMNNWRI